MDKIIIRDLKIEAIVGLYAWERAVKQTLWLDMDLATDITMAAQSCDLDQTIDYSAVCQLVVDLIQTEKFELLETLVETTAQKIQDAFPVSWLRLAVSKSDVMTHVGRVGIEIERGAVDSNTINNDKMGSETIDYDASLVSRTE